VKDFDEARALRAQADRGFQIGGEQFLRRSSVRPEATEPWEAVSLDSTQKETLAAIDETVCNLIDSGEKGEAHKRWMKLRSREEDAISLGDMLELVQWLISEQAARPTEPPSNFSDEPEETGTSSMGGSSLQVVPEESTV
jgi:hypothetical protein